MTRLAVMVSGGGTNLQALIDAAASGVIRAQIAVVISNKDGVYAIKRAQQAHIPVRVIKKKDYAEKQAFDEANLNVLKEFAVDGIVLAGYLSILGRPIIQGYQNKIINIHPALIPAFCGMGFYGEKVHQAVIDYGAKISGATVHFVDEGADTGPIIMQETVPVFQEDTPRDLAERILILEHKILIKSVALFCDGKLSVKGRKVYIK